MKGKTTTLSPTIGMSRYAMVPTWGELTQKRAVFRDSHGEHIRLFAGKKMYHDVNPYVYGCMGFIIGAPDSHSRIMRMSTGDLIEIPAEILRPMQWDVNQCAWV